MSATSDYIDAMLRLARLKAADAIDGSWSDELALAKREAEEKFRLAVKEIVNG